MRVLGILISIAVGVFLIGNGSAQEKKEPTNKEKIIGVWELTKPGEGGKLPVGATMEYTRDGKIKMTGNADGKEFMFDGTYVVEGNKLTAILKTSDREEKGTLTIKELTDKVLVTEDDVGRRVMEFKRKK
jgi:uncharacterized protein (TIGR03066 family)